MSNRSQHRIKPLRADVSADKETHRSRTGCAHVVGTNGPNSELWKATPEIQAAGTKLVAAGTALAGAETTVEALQSQLDTALHARGSRVVEFDAAHTVYVAQVEAHATTAEDITSLGLTVFAKNTYSLVAPLGIEATFDAAKGRIQIHVTKAPGRQACVVEVSSNPADPASWQRLPGFGAVHKLSGYAPGTYWVRAASARANEISEFTGPVSVIVR